MEHNENVTATVRLTYDAVRKIAGAVVPFAGKDDMVPVLGLVEIRTSDSTGGTVIATATDRYRLAALRVPAEHISGAAFASEGYSFAIEGALLATMVKGVARSARGVIDFNVHDNGAVSAVDALSGTTWRSDTTDQQMPPLAKLMAGALDDARSARDAVNPPAAVAVGFNPAYLADLKKASTALKVGRVVPPVAIHPASGPNKPRLFTIEQNFVVLYMPMRLDSASDDNPLDGWASEFSL